MKRVVLFVEGHGDIEAVPALVCKLLTEGQHWAHVALDAAPFRISSVHALTTKWSHYLRAALKRPNVGGILVVLDGDANTWEGRQFCAADVAQTLVERAKSEGAGATFSLAFVFACMEFETWLLAGIESLAGKFLSDGRPGVRADVTRIDGDLELGPRDAKGTLGALMHAGYKPSIDQRELAHLVDIDAVRSCGLRSFRRLEDAVTQMASACRTGKHVATPPSP